MIYTLIYSLISLSVLAFMVAALAREYCAMENKWIAPQEKRHGKIA